MDERLPKWIRFDDGSSSASVAKAPTTPPRCRDAPPSWLSSGGGGSPRRVSHFDQAMTTSPAFPSSPDAYNHLFYTKNSCYSSPMMLSNHTEVASQTTIERADWVRHVSSSPADAPPRPLAEICRRGLWVEAMRRCQTHPYEIFPVPLRIGVQENRCSPDQRTPSSGGQADQTHTIYQEFALGIICATADMSQPGQEEVIEALIRQLLQTGPAQVRCGQWMLGHTPLRDALRNPTCTSKILHCLLSADASLSENDSVARSSLVQRDRDGLYPLDHAIQRVSQNSAAVEGEQSLSLLATLLQFTDKNFWSSHVFHSSPLVRLFSLGTATSSFANVPSSGNESPRRHAHPSRQLPNTKPRATFNDGGRLGRILECTRMLLHAHAPLIHKRSSSTKCSPLHVALRNYGNFAPLIRELLSADEESIGLGQRNHYGDLPLHVACSSGVPVDVLRLVLARTVATSTAMQQKQPPIHQPGDTVEVDFIWSTNNAGYTLVDLEWIRHIEAGNGFFSHRAFYALDIRGVQRPRGRYDDLYDSLLRQAADQVLSSSPLGSICQTRRAEQEKVFGLLLHRIFLIIRAAFHDSFSRSPFDLSGDILHQASALCMPCDATLPLPILEIILWQYPEQATRRDHLGKVPLHHAVQISALRPDNKCERKATAWLKWVCTLLRMDMTTAKVMDDHGRLPLHCALDTGMHKSSTEVACANHQQYSADQQYPAVCNVVKELVDANPESTQARDPVSRLFPFMQAAANPHVSLDTTYWLLRRSPGVFV